MFKKALVIACAMVAFACSTAAAEPRDMKLCNTSLTVTNTTDSVAIYHVAWLSHDVPELKGKPFPRCGGEIKAGEIHEMSVDFKLCPGTYAIIWHIDGKRIVIMFLVRADTKMIVLTPENAFEKVDAFYKAPELEGA